MTTDPNKTDGLLPTTRKPTGHNLQKTQSLLSLRPQYPHTQHTQCQHNFTNIILMADKNNIQNGKMYSNCRFLTDHIVCKITQRNNMMRANTCVPALKLLNEEITSDIQNLTPLRCTLGSQAQHAHSLKDHTTVYTTEHLYPH